MKKQNQGFIVPLLVLIIAVLVIGGGIYIINLKKNNIAVQTETTASTDLTTPVTTPPLQTPTNSPIPNPIVVAGMQQYTDKNFGFSFWYPAKWQVISDTTNLSTTNLQGGSLVKKLNVKNETGDSNISIQEFHSPTLTITDSGGAGPFGPITYYFNPGTHSWMVSPSDQAGTGIKPASKAITTFKNTMGGLHMLGGTSRFDTVIIPLSADNFVVISDNGGVNSQYLSNTVVALDPSVATPESRDAQIKTVQAEALQYGILGTRMDSWFVDSKYVYDFQGNAIIGANPATFRIITTYSDGYMTNGTGYATDGVHVYSGWSQDHPVLEGADPATFVAIRQQYQVPYAPSSGKYGQSFTSYDTEFAKDASHVWFMGKLIPGADPKTFVVTGNTLVVSTNLAHDAHHTYGQDAKGNITIDGVSIMQ